MVKINKEYIGIDCFITENDAIDCLECYTLSNNSKKSEMLKQSLIIGEEIDFNRKSIQYMLAQGFLVKLNSVNY